MQIREIYSHLNGKEYILVHQLALWNELEEVIASVNAEACRTKVSNERNQVGKLLYSPVDLNQRFKEFFTDRGWHSSTTSYWVTSDYNLIRKTLSLQPDEQRAEILAAGKEPLYSFNQTDFVKDRIAIEVQFGKYAFVAFDLFVKHMAFYVGNVIDVGIEILPMKAMTGEMSSGIGYYERELYNLIRQGRGIPAVPLVLIGVIP